MSSYKTSAAESILIDLVHDLRQNLGTIETSVYCLGLLEDSVQPRAHNYLRTIEQQVARAESRLSQAGAELSRLRAQRADAGEILDLTNSTTSSVT
jgi:uncharacterized protein involved in exopolysaccharide biosynthesis